MLQIRGSEKTPAEKPTKSQKRQELEHIGTCRSQDRLWILFWVLGSPWEGFQAEQGIHIDTSLVTCLLLTGELMEEEAGAPFQLPSRYSRHSWWRLTPGARGVQRRGRFRYILEVNVVGVGASGGGRPRGHPVVSSGTMGGGLSWSPSCAFRVMARDKCRW